MADSQEDNLTVTGTGKVQVAPDEAVVHLGIITEGATAAEAVAVNARQTQAVIDAVSAQPNHGVTTSGLSVYPIIDYEQGAGTIVGFRATNGVQVKTDIEYVGQIYDAGVAAGANQSSGITFRVRDEAPYREEALRLAVDEAFREANIVASAATVDLGGVESIQVEPGDGFIIFRSEARDIKIAATPVIPEPQTITARVHMRFHAHDRVEAQPARMERGETQTPATQSGTA